MEFDFSKLAPHDRYKLLISVVVPRPIAFLTTISAAGEINAAPFSFFNAMGGNPPVVAISIGELEEGTLKDSARNIEETREFVVNLVDTSLAKQMNICAADFPARMNEMPSAGLTAVPSVVVKPPRIAESPVNMECRLHTIVPIGSNRIHIGEVVHLRIRDEMIDMEKLHVHTQKLDLIGRMHGGGWYARTTDLFEMPRLSYKEVISDRPEAGCPPGGA